MENASISLRRSQLGTPANERDLIEKAVHSTTDEICLDLEDSLAPSEKQSARSALVDMTKVLDWSSTILSYRINAVDTRWWYQDVITVVGETGDTIDNIIIPKVSRASDVQTVENLLRQVEKNAGLDIGAIDISVQIENALAMNKISEIVTASDRLTAVIFGPADYATSIGATGHRFDSAGKNPERYWQYALSRISHAASSANLLSIGGPYADVEDIAGFRNWCRYERRLGYDGKLVLTPEQAATANEVFTPSLEEAKRAKKIVDRYTTTDSHSIASIDGNVIDREMYEMAKQIVAKATKADLI